MSDNKLPRILADFFRSKPKNVEGQMTRATCYYKRKILRLIFSRFDFTLPDNWDKDYFLTTLFINGYIAIVNTSYGVLALQCGYFGINVFNRPTTININNPILGNLQRTINENGVLCKLQYDYRGIDDIISHYAELLATCDCSVNVSLMNSRQATVFEVEDKKTAESVRQMYSDISAGKPAVFVRNGTFETNQYCQNVKNTFIANDILICKRKIINEMLTEFGINNANVDKKERLNEEEVNSNDEECYFYVKEWLRNIEESFKKANKMFPELNLKVSLSKVPSTELVESVVE